MGGQEQPECLEGGFTSQNGGCDLSGDFPKLSLAPSTPHSRCDRAPIYAAGATRLAISRFGAVLGLQGDEDFHYKHGCGAEKSPLGGLCVAISSENKKKAEKADAAAAVVHAAAHERSSFRRRLVGQAGVCWSNEEEERTRKRRRAPTSRRPRDWAEIASCEQGVRFTPPRGLRPCCGAIVNTSPWHLMQNTRLEIPSNPLSIPFPWETKLTFVNGEDLIALMLRGEREGKTAGYVTLTTASDGTCVQWPSHRCRYEEPKLAQPR